MQAGNFIIERRKGTVLLPPYLKITIKTLFMFKFVMVFKETFHWYLYFILIHTTNIKITEVIKQ